MHKPANHSAAELLTILSARQLEDGQVVFAGVGIPLLAATLAQRLRCPGLTILFEGGVSTLPREARDFVEALPAR